MPESAPDPSDTEVAAIARAVTQLARRLRSHRPAASVTIAALGLLSTLHRQGSMAAVALAKAERLQPQSLSRLIARLDKDGLIARAPDPADGRVLLLSITPAGRRALRADMQARRDWLAGALAESLSAEERETLLRAAPLMQRLVEAA